MKKQDIRSLISLIASPVLLMVLGAILLFSPDSAAALLSKILGWCLVAAGAGFGIAAVKRPTLGIGQLVAAVVCIGLGGTLVRHPLALASGIGCILGVVLMARGLGDIFQGVGSGWGIVTALLGLALVFSPLFTSRLIFSLCGLVMAVVGVCMLADRLRRRRLDPGDNDPNIIDAL